MDSQFWNHINGNQSGHVIGWGDGHASWWSANTWQFMSNSSSVNFPDSGNQNSTFHSYRFYAADEYAPR
jgi:hypothetical protein